MKTERRKFLSFLALTPPLALALRAGDSSAQQKAGAMPHVEESDPQAQALGYKHDASKVDKKKFASFKEGETCANCQHFSGKPGEAWGPCAIFPGKQVAAKGWCSAWAKKA